MESEDTFANNHIKDYVIVTDACEKNSVLEYVDELIRKFGLSLRKIKTISSTELEEKIREVEKRNKNHSFDRAIFDWSFNEVREISLEILRNYSKEENHSLYKQLIENPNLSTEQLKEILWKDFIEKSRMNENLSELVTEDIAKKVSKENPVSHLFTVLFKYRLFHSQVGNNGIFDYHAVGRGFYGFGNTMELLRGSINTEITLEPVRKRGLNPIVQKAFARKYLYHEWVGHTTYGLKDHFDISGSECIMGTEPSLDSAIKNALERPSIYFCKECQAKIDTVTKPLKS